MFDSLAGLTFADILPFIAVGFAAQIVDGALGMAFGVIAQTLLVSLLGVPPASASASVHLVEVFTTGPQPPPPAASRNPPTTASGRVNCGSATAGRAMRIALTSR